MNKLKKIFGGHTNKEKKSNENYSDHIDVTPTTSTANITRSSAYDVRTIQNFCLVWLDSDVDKVNDTIVNLRQIVNTIERFTDIDRCIEFASSIENEKIFLISSDEFAQRIVPVVQHMDQVNSVYIFSKDQILPDQWTKEWTKVKGIYTDLTSIGKALKQSAQECDQNSVLIRLVKRIDGTSHKKLDQLNPSLMYCQILKEILLTIDFQQSHIHEYLSYCREQFIGNEIELKNINLIEQEYQQHQPFGALRTMQIPLIIKMGFFIRDLHNHIVALHAEQYGTNRHTNPFIVYRGQGLSKTDFDQLKNNQGGLLSFNNFLSTSQNQNVSLDFARRTMTTSNLIGILFIIRSDPAITGTPFANIKNVSYFQDEEEILFSMNSIFRIQQIKQLEQNNRLWQIDLTLTSDNDPQLVSLAKQIRQETFPSAKGWYRLGNLLIILGQFNKAQEVFDLMLHQTTDQKERAHIYHMVGMVKDKQEKFDEAIAAYHETIRIYNEIRSANAPDIATTYNNMANVYYNIKDYSNALIYYEKALYIQRKILDKNDPTLATSYNNLASVYDSMGEYAKALSYHEKALKMKQKSLPKTHPNLATSYHNIAAVYQSMEDYPKALSNYERAFDIFQRSLPPDHPDLDTVKLSIEFVERKQNVKDFYAKFDTE